MEIKRFTRYNKLGTRQIVGLLIIIALIVIFAYVILCQNDNIVFTVFFAVPFKVAEFIIDDNGIKCTNASDILNTDFVSYLKCHFDFKTDEIYRMALVFPIRGRPYMIAPGVPSDTHFKI